MTNELIEALCHAEHIASDAPTSTDEVNHRAWAIVYLLQRHANPAFAPDNYEQTLAEARAFSPPHDEDDIEP